MSAASFSSLIFRPLPEPAILLQDSTSASSYGARSQRIATGDFLTRSAVQARLAHDVTGGLVNGLGHSRSLGIVLLGAVSLASPAFAGDLKGKVVVAGSVPQLKKIDITIDQYLCGTQKDAEDLLLSPQKEIRNAVVWLDNPPAGGKPPALPEKVEIDQKACVFIPRVVIVPAGGTVDFLNSDRLLHNIHATPKANLSFNRTQPKSRTIPITFAKPEIIRINCELHSWMSAWVVVAAHPYYAITGPDGQFSFDNLPAGQYKLQIWHERLGTVSASATVADKQTARVTVEMKAP
jgi:plastocyanin